jgi:4-coumarate--CoA ligase
MSLLVVDQYDMSALETLCSGAAPLGAALSKQVIDRFTPKRKGKNPLKILQGQHPVTFWNSVV